MAPPDNQATQYEAPAFLQAMLESLPAFVVRLDRELRVRYINRLQPGITREQVIGASVFDFIAPEHRELERTTIERALATGQPQSFVIKGTGSDGGVAYYESRMMPMDDDDGQRVICVIAQEVTEHVARAEALRESEERLRLALDATGMGLWSWDVASGRIEGNERLREIIGTSAPISPEDYVQRFVHRDDRAAVAAHIMHFDGGEPTVPEHRIVRPDGSVRWVFPVGRGTHDASGKLVRVIGGTLDVTERRRLEEQAQRTQKLQAVGDMTSGMAHNFNNMLAVLLPTLQLLRRSGHPDQAQLLADAEHAAQRAAEMVAQLMTFAGQRASTAHFTQPLGPIVERVLSMCRSMFGEQISLLSTLDPECPVVDCDAAGIEQVLVNLLLNARDAVQAEAFGPPALVGGNRPRIEVELAACSACAPGSTANTETPHVCLRVRDNGIGMSTLVQRRLFEPFFTTKEPGKGTGLGLATSYAIARNHDGFISFHSELGVGTTVSLFLPVSTSQQPSPRTPVPQLDTVGGAELLIVDDEASVRRVLTTLLSEHGHRVQSAADGTSALALIDAGARPALVLLDRSMPGLPAKTLLAELRKRLPGVPVLFFTGQDVTPEERALVQAVIYKPLSSDELIETIDRWIARTTTTANGSGTR